jgi:hypothetical protein
LINFRSAFSAIVARMVGKADELSRLNGRIAEFERCVAEMRVHPGSGSPLFSGGERIQMLQMLVTTLETMKARRAALERAGQAGCRPQPPSTFIPG